MKNQNTLGINSTSREPGSFWIEFKDHLGETVRQMFSEAKFRAIQHDFS